MICVYKSFYWLLYYVVFKCNKFLVLISMFFITWLIAQANIHIKMLFSCNPEVFKIGIHISFVTVVHGNPKNIISPFLIIFEKIYNFFNTVDSYFFINGSRYSYYVKFSFDVQFYLCTLIFLALIDFC